jgi:hypothetical protein
MCGLLLHALLLLLVCAEGEAARGTPLASSGRNSNGASGATKAVNSR